MKLALVGGGSVRTVYFAESLAKFADELGIKKISIMDNDSQKLEIFGNLAEYVLKAGCCSVDFEKTENLQECVYGADYVVTTMRVGQDKARCMDERIALSHGVIGQETTGAGGFSYAMRSIPAMAVCCEEISRFSNNAVIFNFTNPSGLVTQAMHDLGYDNVVGICDNATGIKMDLSKTLGVNANDIIVRIYGLNHLSWADEVRIGKRDILSRLIENNHFLQNFHQFEYFDRDLIRQLGRIPNGYLYYYYHREKALENMLKSPKTRGESIMDINLQMLDKLLEADAYKTPDVGLEIFRKYMHMREGSYMQMEMGGEKNDFQGIDISALGIAELENPVQKVKVYEGYAGVAFNYIEAVVKNKETDLALNVKNSGSIEGFEDDDIVEVTCNVDKNGAIPVKIGKIPKDSFLLMKQIKYYEKLSIQAIIERSKPKAVKALMENPLVGSYSLSKKLVDEYVKLNEPFTGEWKL